ncbi:2-octaprenyl-6-methoxyphenol hydroxylase /2-octaprenyl-3-methyl-6-methoxy-1,4-benzoquinol hydroxylase [Rhodothalassium salexigens DSM 2132]|uniref:2-octaprenyl-6-methoxyphenol hydroxylase /2-octaprenyl-3-methyl-6-methoxy-1,4-benzoquinol hydroxylase n=1 Tax=Rhodothalassium salexigens DSM 2132 TaxID=1188247 RepID=A0A4R2P8X4_RHOSA|nr:UbiH/UbiF/VisC/COQ6 family ubiquinone biosynthesis hydroxylase [Rhodothalassium salexigens]MBB4212511.1 2-octaprenyl-6-methoxyphenol hydroxylase [Rhodothalassium salexigens DSM 2132]MBK1638480.1 2-octaprenyl-6-methoxyphenyl hydroxylase [Rhodothalassium salexigens DSM 2132]TCP31449.1 2-octaprenyl-6-methoxyphenol hydroxylase /2-octaprenyl-3-methyl-6-methoxy-1,4-benzoquinol hydroxylase [Rhodothalassium salexigens DSM 2132]
MTRSSAPTRPGADPQRADRAQTSRADVAIIGGGLVGLTTAVGLAQQGLSVCVVDRQPLPATLDPAFDGRATAVAHASKLLFEALDLWPAMDAHAQPILEIRVSDGPSLMHLHFDHDDLGDGPLGFLVENRYLRQAMADKVAGLDAVEVVAPEAVETIERSEAGARVALASGRVIEAALVLACDGRGSATRSRAGIDIMRWSYDQMGIVATIHHELPHAGIAHERFLPDGPFAILPLRGNRSSLVWTVPTAKEPAIMGLGPRGFEAEVRRRVGDFLGQVTVEERRWSYPLSLHLADRITDTRLALVGDAAHGIHPIAGQGFNLGLRDVAALIEVIVDARRLGLDIGSAEVLGRYARWRRADTVVLAAVTDGLNRLFSNDVTPVRLARDIGLAAVDRIGPLKTFFMRQARGSIGNRPRLLDGQAL